MLTQALFFVLGLATLVAGAEMLVRGASRLAVSWGITPLVVGLTVVAFGTSAPEMAVSIGATLSGSANLAIGNVVGSNIANVLLILGLSAVIAPLVVHEQIIQQEIPILIGASLIVVAMALDGYVGRVESALLFIGALAYTAFLVTQSRRAAKDAASDFSVEIPGSTWDRHWSIQTLLILGGLGLLVLGADWLVGASVVFAKLIGVSDLVIGLTLVAIGTSMPEIATSLIAALRGQRDIAVGNVIGSNIFNLLAVLGAAGVAAPSGLAVPEAARTFDLWVMLAVAFACLPILLTGRQIARWEGALFLAYYAAYTIYLLLMAQQHDALTAYSNIMLSFVVPLTIVTLLVSFAARHR